MFVRLNNKQMDKKIDFISNYLLQKNAADGSTVDANANVSTKNIATLSAEINKDINIQINRRLLYKKIEELFGKDDADKYIEQLESHEIYTNDESSLLPYCTSITMYPFLFDGLTKLGGESKAPKHLEAFCGGFVNLIFAVSSQFAGAVAAVEFLMYFDYFAKKEFGENYLQTNEERIKDHLQSIIYTINQPAAARGYQSVFFNTSVFDRHYFESMFGEFVFPDFSSPSWESVSKLQEYFLFWIKEERKKSILTFPVITAAVLTEESKPRDEEFVQMLSKNLADGGTFFVYMSDSADSLSSCCRLKSKIVDNSFSYSLGAGGVSTGSVNVITLNLNRLVQNGTDLLWQVRQLHKYQVAYRAIMQEFLDANILTVYDAGFIDMKKQYLTIGLNGIVEAAESSGIRPGNTKEYRDFVQEILKVVYEENREATKLYGHMFNTEFVPAENLGVKNAAWDKSDNLMVSRDCYNSYFFPVEDTQMGLLEKFSLYDSEMIKWLDGGSALHLNLEHHPKQYQYVELFNLAAAVGCNYWTTNIKSTICNSCGNIDLETFDKCPKCGSEDIDYGTRVVGFVKRISSFSKARREEASRRAYLTE